MTEGQIYPPKRRKPRLTERQALREIIKIIGRFASTNEADRLIVSLAKRALRSR